MSIEHDNNSNSNHTRMENIRIMRSLMAEAGIDAMMVPTDDPHMSEYPSSDYKRREFISGFTGSAGTVVITQDKTLLFTDGRYHKQAENELDPTWTLMKVGMKDVPNPVEYLTKELSEGTVVGIDPLVHAATAYELIKKTLGERCISMKLLGHNPIDAIWGSNRPSKPSGLIREHPLQYAGKTVDEKLKEIRPLMQKEGCSSLVLSTLDDIAWLFNFRGSDVPCNPVSVCYAILTLGKKVASVEWAAYLTYSNKGRYSFHCHPSTHRCRLSVHRRRESTRTYGGGASSIRNTDQEVRGCPRQLAGAAEGGGQDMGGRQLGERSDLQVCHRTDAKIMMMSASCIDASSYSVALSHLRSASTKCCRRSS